MQNEHGREDQPVPQGQNSGPCCHKPEPTLHNCCEPAPRKIDFILWGSVSLVTLFYLQYLLLPQTTLFAHWYSIMTSAVYEFMNRMWWGLAVGILMVALLVRVPREFVMALLGNHRGMGRLLRATLAGVLLDLCSHGILMVASQLYRKGASPGQVMAFLIASPWNSLSLTFILFALIGVWWTLGLILLSALIALVTGVIFDALVERRVLPANPNHLDLPEDFRFWPEARAALAATHFDSLLVFGMLKDGLSESRMVLRWILFGVLLAAVIRAVMSEDMFSTWFGPSVTGLALTLLAATIIEVCSEGSVPIAADLFTRASAPGNSFTFLMAGVSTDYTEIMVLKDSSNSWKTALFLPLVTVPQILLLALVLNALA